MSFQTFEDIFSLLCTIVGLLYCIFRYIEAPKRVYRCLLAHLQFDPVRAHGHKFVVCRKQSSVTVKECIRYRHLLYQVLLDLPVARAEFDQLFIYLFTFYQDEHHYSCNVYNKEQCDYPACICVQKINIYSPLFFVIKVRRTNTRLTVT